VFLKDCQLYVCNGFKVIFSIFIETRQVRYKISLGPHVDNYFWKLVLAANLLFLSICVIT